MLIRRAPEIASSEVTDEGLYHSRREWLRAAGVTMAALATQGVARAAQGRQPEDKPTPYDVITTYNNFYEFGTAKEDPARNGGTLRTRPWVVKVSGEVKRPASYDLDDLLKGLPVVERTYRMRCVEAWSMVIPWQGVRMVDLIRKLDPGSNAKYVEFVTLYDPKQMPGQRSRTLDWPYVEALRLDEATHPLTLMATGIYGKPLLNQNGAPLRLTVPWKYGFKSGKSIVEIRFSESQPATTWNAAAPQEYGFYANVNPDVSHPRWSQAVERMLGTDERLPTQLFNGYGPEVAHLYAGLKGERLYM